MKKIFFLITLISISFSACKKNDDVKVADELKYATDFSEDDHLWYRDADHIITPGSNGHYTMNQSQANYQSWAFAPYATINYNYSIRATVKLNFGTLGCTGLVYNFLDNDHYYAFYTLNDGTFYAFKKSGPEFTSLVNRSYSAVIKAGVGQTNFLEVRQSGNTASFLVNGTQIGSCQSVRGPGLVRAGIALATTTDPITGDFDNVSIWKIQ